MAVGVYRLYVGQGWMREGAFERLTLRLDRVPGLLYQTVALPPAAEAPAADAGSDMRFRARISLTQAHLAILHPDDIAASTDEALAVIDLARKGFRRRIPLLAIVESVDEATLAAQRTKLAAQIDGVVALRSEDIASALQDLVEQSAADVRLKAETGVHRAAGGAPALSQAAADLSRTTERALPISAIVSAHATLKAQRNNGHRGN